jgi:hypothetical protein
VCIVLLAVFGSGQGQQVVFGDDMSSFPTNWTLGSNGTTTDSWAKKAGRWYSSSAAAKCTRSDANYQNNVNVWMEHAVSLAGNTLGTITFWIWQYTENGRDYAHFECSTNGGASWNNLWQRAGNFSTWQRITITGIPSATNAIRFRFSSDFSNVYEGVYLDDVVLYGINATANMVWADDMTSFPVNWNLSGTRTWGPETAYHHSDSVAAQCAGQNSGYYNNQSSTMSRATNLGGCLYGIFSFWVQLNTEPGADILYAQYHTPAGWVTPFMNSGSLGWTEFSYTIPSNTDSVRFFFTSNGSVTSDGAYVDDVAIIGVTAPAVDIAATAIVSPPSNVDSAASVPVSATIRNNSAVAAGTPVYFQIGSGSSYRAMTVVDNVPAGETATAAFPNWAVNLPRGTCPMKCSTAHFSDILPGNDTLLGSVTVGVKDVATLQILAPSGTVDSGVALEPQARVQNNGTSKATFKVRFTLGTYCDSQAVTDLEPATPYVVSFTAWNATQRGNFTAKCTTLLAGDVIGSNNRKTGGVEVAVHDVGAVEITAPAGTIPQGGVIPMATLHNYGTRRDSADATFLINSSPPYVAVCSLPRGLPVGFDTVIGFEIWGATPGSYTTRCSTHSGRDQVPENDVAADDFTVTASPPETGWVRKADVPPGRRNKRVKEGGCLAYNEEGGAGYVYALKGNGTYEFYRYSPLINAWTARESIPAIGCGGRKKSVKKGACLTPADGNLFATKGNNTVEFWQYSPQTTAGIWTQMSDIPTGARNLKEGSGAVGVKVGDTTYVYLLKGAATWEFYRYNTLANTWQTMPDAPTGISGKPFKNGSGLVYDPDNNTIFALKGSYNEFFSYNVDSNRWLARTGMPLYNNSGVKKKAKDGACLAYHNGAIFALKGGNTQEFWVFQVDTNRWAQFPDMPITGNKRVKGGAALVYAQLSTALFATKGNGTFEFWKYGLAAADRLPPNADPSTVANFLILSAFSHLSVAPNPFSGAATVSYALTRAGNVRLELYDVTGKLLRILANGPQESGRYTIFLSRGGELLLARGIYLLKFESADGHDTQKVIVE